MLSKKRKHSGWSRAFAFGFAFMTMGSLLRRRSGRPLILCRPNNLRVICNSKDVNMIGLALV